RSRASGHRDGARRRIGGAERPELARQDQLAAYSGRRLYGTSDTGAARLDCTLRRGQRPVGPRSSNGRGRKPRAAERAAENGGPRRSGCGWAAALSHSTITSVLVDPLGQLIFSLAAPGGPVMTVTRSFESLTRSTALSCSALVAPAAVQSTARGSLKPEPVTSSTTSVAFARIDPPALFLTVAIFTSGI